MKYFCYFETPYFPLNFLHDSTLSVTDIHQNMLISLFETPYDHFHFHPISVLGPDLILTVCHKIISQPGTSEEICHFRKKDKMVRHICADKEKEVEDTKDNGDAGISLEYIGLTVIQIATYIGNKIKPEKPKGDKKDQEEEEGEEEENKEDEEDKNEEEEDYEWDDVKLPSGWQIAVVNVPAEGQFLGFREVGNPGVFTDFSGALRRMKRHPDEDKKAQLVAYMESGEFNEYRKRITKPDAESPVGDFWALHFPPPTGSPPKKSKTDAAPLDEKMNDKDSEIEELKRKLGEKDTLIKELEENASANTKELTKVLEEKEAEKRRFEN